MESYGGADEYAFFSIFRYDQSPLLDPKAPT
jgi:hypothetical protein